MRRTLRLALLAAVTGALSLAVALPAQAANIKVHAGQSIQAAIDKAKHGDTITVDKGTYHENLTITKDRIKIKGAGIGKTILEPGAQGTGVCVDPTDPTSVNGICVLGSVDQDFNPINPPVKGAEISGLTIQGFPGFGFFAFNAKDLKVDKTEAAWNGSYGISGFVLQNVKYTNDVAHDNGEPGFYVGDSPNANATLEHDTSYRNGVGGDEGFGMLLRDSSKGKVRENTVWGNCAGIVFADTNEDPAPVTNWTAEKNTVTANDGACSGGGGPPPFSGVGIILLGASSTKVTKNTVNDNVPSGPSIASGGIVVVSSAAVGGADPTNDKIDHNTLSGNSPFDILWDGSGSGNSFTHNHCSSSLPGGLCS